MIVLLGGSASGKTSVTKYLSENYGLRKIVSYTTRPIRDGEEDGCDYHFVSEEYFSKLVDKNFFLETATYNNWKYGTAWGDVTDKSIIAVTPHGLRNLKKVSGLHLISFYIDVPRRDMLIKALQRGDSIDEAYRRSVSDIGMYDGISSEVDFILSNPGYVKSVRDLCEEIVERCGQKGIDLPMTGGSLTRNGESA